MATLKIRRARQKKGITQTELSEMVNATKQSICNWEHGRGIPNYEKLKKLSQILGVPIEELFNSADERHDTGISKTLKGNM